MPDQPSVTLGQGDPVWTIYTWRQDSITLTRLRPFIEEITVLADEPCTLQWEHGGTKFTCLTTPPDDTLTGAPCLACRLKQLRARIYGYNNTSLED